MGRFRTATLARLPVVRRVPVFRAAADPAVPLPSLRLPFWMCRRLAAAAGGARRLALGALLAWLCPGPGAAQAENLATADAKSRAVAQTVFGILGYTRWPDDPPVIRLCVVGPTEFADEILLGGEVPQARRIEVRRLRLNDAALSTECEGVYAGQLTDAEWRQLLDQRGGRPLLSISERRDLCRIGCMFCLDVRQEGVGFESNLDSVARSGVRVNPRVLQLSRRKAAP